MQVGSACLVGDDLYVYGEEGWSRVTGSGGSHGGILLATLDREPNRTITFCMEGKPDLTIDMKDMLRFIALCRAMKMADEGMAEKDDHKRSMADEMAMIALYAYNPPPEDERQWFIDCFHVDPWADEDGVGSTDD